MMCAGVVGLGIGTQHALAILANDYCKLRHLCDFDIKKLETFKEEHFLYEVKISAFEELLQDENLDIIFIASFDDCHYQQVMEGLKKNKHVFVEKPLCQTWKQLVFLHETFEKKRCALMSNLVLRTSDLFQYMKKLIAEGELGEIFYFEGDYLYGRLHKITEGWRKNVNEYSVMSGGGIHMIDLMVSLTGQNPDYVSSTANKIATKNTDFRYHDFHSSTFYFSSGLIAKITANFGCIHPHQHVVKIYGTKGTFIYDDQGARLFKSRFDKAKPELLHQKAKPEKKFFLIDKFIQLIINGDFKAAAQREFDLMSMVIASDEALTRCEKTKVKYLTCR